MDFWDFNFWLFVFYAFWKRARYEYWSMENAIKMGPVYDYLSGGIQELQVTDEGVVEDLNPINSEDPWEGCSYLKGERPPWFQVLNE